MFIMKRHYNHRIEKYARKGMVPPKSRHLLSGMLWNTAKRSYAASSQRQKAFEGAMESALYGFLKGSPADYWRKESKKY